VLHVDGLLGALLLSFDQGGGTGSAHPVIDDEGPVLFVDEVEGIRCDVQAPGVPAAPLLVYPNLHISPLRAT
jgi:hypothetical protein